MAHIPTTERKYYNTEKKLNTLAAYSSAMLPAAQNMQQVIAQQEEIKMDSYALEARMEMNEITNNWRIQNEGNPTDPTALKDLQSQYDDVLGKYREQVDPLYRYNWDIAGNKLKGAFDLQNQEWGFAQKQKNARANIARSVDNYIKLAYQYGQEDSEAEAMADFAQSYQKLLDYGAKNLGAEDAAKLLGSYQEKFVTSYLGGVASKDPNKAMKMLTEDKDLKAALGDEQAEVMGKLIKKIKAQREYETQVSQFTTELQLEEDLDKVSPFIALDELEKNKDAVSDKWYKAKKKTLLNQTSAMDETVADTYTDLLIRSQEINKDNANEIMNQSNELLTAIEEASSKGDLKPEDKKKLINEVIAIRKEALPEFIESSNSWFDYGIKDAYADFSNSLINEDNASDAMLEYHRTISNGDYNAEQKRQLAKTITDKYNKNSLIAMSVVDYKLKPTNVAKNKLGNSQFGTMSILSKKMKDVSKQKYGVPTFNTQADAERAYKRGEINIGDTIIISGVRGQVK
jgi:hypothetical protein